MPDIPQFLPTGVDLYDARLTVSRIANRPIAKSISTPEYQESAHRHIPTISSYTGDRPFNLSVNNRPLPLWSTKMPDQGGEAPKIQIDSDWKAQAQAEKERLREQEEISRASAGSTTASGAEGESGAGNGEFPPASWDTLMGSLVSQAMMYLGAFGDPQTGKPIIDLDAARHYIDLMGVLEEKTKGNLNDDEAKNLSTVIYELRMRYVQIAQAAQNAGVPGGPVGGGAAMGAGAGGPDLGFTGGGGGGASNIGDVIAGP